MTTFLLFILYCVLLIIEYRNFVAIPLNHALILLFTGICALVDYAVDRIVKAIKEK